MRESRVQRLCSACPLEEPEFVWPTEAKIRTLQRAARDAGDDLQRTVWRYERGLMVMPSCQVWIPPDAGDQQQRLCVIAHAGASGHRGLRATLQALETVFFWENMASDVSTFTRGCLHGMTTASGRFPRSFGETLKATKPNEPLHSKCLTTVEGTGGNTYVMVLKDGMSEFGGVDCLP